MIKKFFKNLFSPIDDESYEKKYAKHSDERSERLGYKSKVKHSKVKHSKVKHSEKISGSSNLFIGYNAGMNNTTGINYMIDKAHRGSINGGKR